MSRRRNRNNRRNVVSRRRNLNRRERAKDKITLRDPVVTDVLAQPRQTRVFRYKGDGTSIVSIDRKDLLCSLNYWSGTQATSLIDSIKIDKVRIIIQPDAAADSANFQFKWTGDHGPDVMHTLNVTNALNAGILLYPPAQTKAMLFSTWDADTGEVLFDIETSASYSVILDIHVTYVIVSEVVAGAVTSGWTGGGGDVATASIPLATAEFKPVGLITMS